MQPGAIIKDPFVLEFLDMDESKRLTESDSESALIDKLQHFILYSQLGGNFISLRKREFMFYNM